MRLAAGNENERRHLLPLIDALATTRGTEYVDKPPKGRWSYRVAMVANWVNDLELGDVLLVSTPARVTVQ